MAHSIENYCRPFSLFASWDLRFLEMANLIASWSKDPSTKVGCVIAQDRRVVGQGFNGFPQGVDDCRERYEDRDVKLAMTVHAEANAIVFAGRESRGGEMFCSLMPCSHCASLIIQAGIFAVTAPKPCAEHMERWGESFATTITMFEEAGVQLILGVHE